MKYLLNAFVLCAVLFLVVSCDSENEDFADLETENVAFLTLPDEEKTSFLKYPNPEMIFRFLDSDEDGRISQEEVENAPKKKMTENFDFLDSNKDGFIGREEMAELSAMVQNVRKGKPNPEILFKILDRDKDGKISREEAENAPRKKLAENFDLIDNNKDGFIEKDEISQMAENGGNGKRNSEMLFKILDSDKDGKISLEEAENAPKRKLAENFDVVDRNNDGFIDMVEIGSFPKIKRN